MSGERLSPARPDGGETAAYGPRVPWKLIVGVVLVAVIGVVAWQLQSAARLSSLKDEVVAAHRAFSDAEAQHEAFRKRIEQLVKRAIASNPPTPLVDTTLELSELYRSEGIYLRVPHTVQPSLEGLEAAALAMTGDGIPRCLGVGPLSLRSFYESGLFLSDAYRDRIRITGEEFVVEALASDIKRAGQQHAATVTTASRSDYFLLLVERGETPRSGPVDVFLWRFGANNTDTLLLRARTTPKGMLIPARIAVGDKRPARRTPLRDSPIADDCSVVAQIKELAGEDPGDEAEAAAASSAPTTSL